MEQRYCQVIEQFEFESKPWLTLWDLSEQVQFSLTLRLERSFELGQLLRLESQANVSPVLNPIYEEDLPAKLEPLVDAVPRPAKIFSGGEVRLVAEELRPVTGKRTADDQSA